MNENLKTFLNESDNLKNDLSQFNERIKDLKNKIEILTNGKDLDFSNDERFYEVVGLLGEYAPIKLLEDLASYYTQQKQKILTKELPSLLNEMGVSKLETEDGTPISLKNEINIKTINKQALLDWLKQHRYEDFIKTNIEFGKGEVNKELTDFLNKNGYSYEKKDDVHYQTLNKIMRDRLESGEELPSENIAIVNTFQIAKIK